MEITTNAEARRRFWLQNDFHAFDVKTILVNKRQEVLEWDASISAIYAQTMDH